MGPDDYLMMFDAYQMRQREEDRQLYLLRHIAFVVHNANSEKATKLNEPRELMSLSIDPIIEKNQEKRVQERKEKSDALFEKARDRGVLDTEDNE